MIKETQCIERDEKPRILLSKSGGNEAFVWQSRQAGDAAA